MTWAKLEMSNNMKLKKLNRTKIDKPKKQIRNPKEALSNVSVTMYLMMHNLHILVCFSSCFFYSLKWYCQNYRNVL